MSDIIVKTPDTLVFNDKKYRCAISKNGVTENKKEGDQSTPTGCFPIRKVMYRKDRVNLPETSLKTELINKNDGWCDDPEDEMYNKKVKLPYDASTESLWRNDHLYDIVVVLGYNDNPPVPGKGSAIFMHIAREEYTPTAGCIALSKEDLTEVLKSTDQDTRICVKQNR